MSGAPTHPLAEHPLDKLVGRPACSLRRHERTYLSTVMLENSLRQCGGYIKGITLDVGCGLRPYERTFFAGANRYVGTDYLSNRSRPDVVCSALDLPFAGGQFDTVVSTEVLQHVQPIGARPVNWLVNTFFLWCDRHLNHDGISMGWTVVARKPDPHRNALPPNEW